MLPAELVARFNILLAPMTVVVNGEPSREPDINLADFYDQLRAGATVSTTAPSPGEILAVYEQAKADGASEIVSLHIGSTQSATVDAARLAAREFDLPVTVVDTGVASFIEGCCVWRAAESLAAGQDVAAAEAAALEVGGSAESVFTIGEIQRANAGGRLAVGDGSGVPIFASKRSDMFQIGSANSEGDAIATMLEPLANHAGPLRVGVGHADAPDAAREFEEAIRNLSNVAEIVQYIVGPSVAAHTGVGTFGAVYHAI